MEEQKEQQIPSTPPEVLEVRKKTTFEAVDQIKQGKKLCTKAIDATSTNWELLLEDETTEKFVEDTLQAELKITAVKTDMKKLPIKEKITKVVKLK